MIGIKMYIIKLSYENNEDLGNRLDKLIAAKSSTTRPSVLFRLARDADPSVREAVASNRDTTKRILRMLAKDSDILIREEVASNPSTASDTLDKLASDKDDIVRAKLVLNSNTSKATLRKLYNDSSLEVLRNIAESLRTPAKILNDLSLHYNSDIRLAIAGNPNIDEETAERLIKDTSDEVRLKVLRTNRSQYIKDIYRNNF